MPKTKTPARAQAGGCAAWAEKQQWTRAERQELISRTEKGDKAALPDLRAMLAVHPETVKRHSNLTYGSRYGMVKEVAGDNLLLPEMLPMHIAAVQRELEGDNPTPLERVLCEHVATCQLAVHLLDVATISTPNGGPAPMAWQEHHDRMKNRAHKRFLAACESLARVRRLLRPQVAQVNILQQPGAPLDAGQIVSSEPSSPA